MSYIIVTLLQSPDARGSVDALLQVIPAFIATAGIVIVEGGSQSGKRLAKGEPHSHFVTRQFQATLPVPADVLADLERFLRQRIRKNALGSIGVEIAILDDNVDTNEETEAR